MTPFASVPAIPENSPTRKGTQNTQAMIVRLDHTLTNPIPTSHCLCTPVAFPFSLRGPWSVLSNNVLYEESILDGPPLGVRIEAERVFHNPIPIACGNTVRHSQVTPICPPPQATDRLGHPLKRGGLVLPVGKTITLEK